MKYKILLLFLVFITTICSSQVNKILIDPGHGGNDFGCNGSNSYEKHINLSISLKLGELINKYMPETKVLYTRKTDVSLNLCKRAVAANKVKPDLYISIHCNFSPNGNSKGMEIFIQDISLSQEELEESKKNINSQYEEEETIDCPKNDLSKTKMITAARLAIKLEKNLSALGLESRGVKKENFMVLRKTKMPAVLIECGFLSNIDEEKFLKSEKGQMLIAGSILKSLIEMNENNAF